MGKFVVAKLLWVARGAVVASQQADVRLDGRGDTERKGGNEGAREEGGRESQRGTVCTLRLPRPVQIRGRRHTELFKKTLCVNVELAAEAQPSVVLFTESNLAKVGNRFARLVLKIEGKSLTPSACSVFQM